MKRSEFKTLVNNNIVILDGALGTELAKRGMPKGVCPEKWALENKDVISTLQQEYISAGSSIIYAPTFGANTYKLEEYGLEKEVYEINFSLAKLTKESCQDRAFAFGNIAPTGRFIEPFGEVSFDEAVEMFSAQVKPLIDGGVDGFVIETMIDIQEARAALFSIRSLSDLPVMVSMTYEKEGRTLNGTDPISAVTILQSLGADAVGCNCSSGPRDMIEIIRKMKPFAKVPLFAKPNAGMPVLKEGKTVFEMNGVEFASFVEEFADAGVNLLGGCCGTGPDHIAYISEKSKSLKSVTEKPLTETVVASSRKSVYVSNSNRITLVGERINPSGKTDLQEGIKTKNYSILKEYILEQYNQGAHILDINVTVPGTDEWETMKKCLTLVAQNVDLPVCIDSIDSSVMEKAIKFFPGRSIINSVNERNMNEMLPIASAYGAAVILMPISKKGIPETFEERKNIIQLLINEAEKHGLDKTDMIIDALALTINASPKNHRITLDTIAWCHDKLQMNSICGISNLTYGLPERQWLNSTFFTMAAARGLSTAFVDTSSDEMRAFAYASNALLYKDKKMAHYIEYFAKSKSTVIKDDVHVSIEDKIYNCVLHGDEEKISDYINSALEEGVDPKSLVDNKLIPAINNVGDKFDKKEYFLPQLIMSADTMRKGFTVLEPYLKNSKNEDTAKEAPTIVIATVQGDIHDIGKNIVALMLKNYSFNVVDLGKDVAAADIIRVAKHHNAQIIGLSALMTTTMVEMKEVIELAKKEKLNIKFMVGGAVVDKNYADEIGADGYASDAMNAVRLAKDLTTDEN